MSSDAPDTLPPDYWDLAQRPLNSLCFLLPLLVAYEVGVFWLGGTQAAALRNGADCWLRGALETVGGKYEWLLPVIIALALLAWQGVSRQPWQVSPETWLGMLAESVLFAFLLVLFGQAQGALFQQWSQTSVAIPAELARGISFLGAGIYEEVLFRLLLIPACYGVWRLLLLPHKPALLMAVLLSSLLFAGAHYVGVTGETFTPFTFTFRVFAGIYFAALFALRGFGIAAGTHAAYDLLVGVLLVR